jgi:WD40-like Beta Propeller Repeat
VRRLLARCLEKDVKRRLRDAGDARLEIDDVLSGAAIDTSTVAPPASPSARARLLRAVLTGVAVAIVAAAAAAASWVLRPVADLPLRKFNIRAKDGARVVDAAISPNGRSVVFLAGEKVWLQQLSSLTPQEVAGVDDVHAVFWSPDSAMLGFQTKGQLWKVAPDGKSVVYECPEGICSRLADGSGQPVVLVPKPATGPSIAPDGTALVFAREQTATSLDLFIVPRGPEGVRSAPVAAPKPIVADKGMQPMMEVSPTGTLAAYSSNETGIYAVYLTEFPSGRGKWHVGAGLSRDGTAAGIAST